MKTALFLFLSATTVFPQTGDPVAGEWRGTLKAAQGTETPFVISIAKKGDQYGAVTSGLTEASEVPLAKISVDGTRVSFEAASESKLGTVTLAGDLTLAGNKLSGPATLRVGLQRFDVAIDLTRRARATVLQRQVERKIDYFVGRWKFDYVGGEFPPLSRGNRSGTVTFSRNGRSNFASGQVEGEIGGAAYRETEMLGIDPDANTMVLVERRGDGAIFTSLGSWKSPLAITFQMAPVAADGKTFQLRRVISITSDDAFDVTEEFSVDGGAFRRLGNGHYTKVP
jgi:hypothetical protein